MRFSPTGECECYCGGTGTGTPCYCCEDVPTSYQATIDGICSPFDTAIIIPRVRCGTWSWATNPSAFPDQGCLIGSPCVDPTSCPKKDTGTPSGLAIPGLTLSDVYAVLALASVSFISFSGGCYLFVGFEWRGFVEVSGSNFSWPRPECPGNPWLPVGNVWSAGFSTYPTSVRDQGCFGPFNVPLTSFTDDIFIPWASFCSTPTDVDVIGV